jgi:hypothetical protein
MSILCSDIIIINIFISDNARVLISKKVRQTVSDSINLFKMERLRGPLHSSLPGLFPAPRWLSPASRGFSGSTESLQRSTEWLGPLARPNDCRGPTRSDLTKGVSADIQSLRTLPKVRFSGSLPTMTPLANYCTSNFSCAERLRIAAVRLRSKLCNN